MNRCNHTDGLEHNCSYVDARNRLIPEAEAITYAAVGPEPVDDAGGRKWVAKYGPVFLGAMDKLWRARSAKRVKRAS